MTKRRKLFLWLALLGAGLLGAGNRVANNTGAAAFTANTAVFDGTNDYLSKTTALTGVANGKVFTASFWLKMGGGDGVYQEIFTILSTNSYRFAVSRDSSDKIALFARNAAGTTILNALSASTITVASGWVHVFICIDLANTSNRKFYFNGSADADGSCTWTTYTNDTIEFVPGTPNSGIGAIYSGGDKLNGSLAEFVFYDTYHDSPASFRSGSSPADIGATGSTPTGSAPDIYLSRNGSGNSWATDSSGNSNTFTVTGALGTTTAP